MAETAIFLGAGASKPEGAPLQGDLFREYFSSPLYIDSHDPMDDDLAAFFASMFGINVDDDVSKVSFPTFEEVLGLVDLAVLRKEGFKHFTIENRATNSGQLRFVAQYLVFLMAKLLDFKLQKHASFHRNLVHSLNSGGVIQDIVFVSTNYDILIDNALTELQGIHGIDVDYGVEFRNFERQNDDWRRPRDPRVCLFKPHGSLNWLFCPICNELEITPKEKGIVTRLISGFAQAICHVCGNIYSPLIVPPTFYKDLNNVYLSSIWSRTDTALRGVNHIVFCGYSFPDSDMHIKYLLKRAQTNRTRPLEFTVINYFPGKLENICIDEEVRYKRFLGQGVRYIRMSFQEFVEKPLAILGFNDRDRRSGKSKE